MSRYSADALTNIVVTVEVYIRGTLNRILELRQPALSFLGYISRYCDCSAPFLGGPEKGGRNVRAIRRW